MLEQYLQDPGLLCIFLYDHRRADDKNISAGRSQSESTPHQALWASADLVPSIWRASVIGPQTPKLSAIGALHVLECARFLTARAQGAC